MPEIIRERGLTNEEFFARHAAPGRVGLVGGNTWVDRIIARAERHLDPDHKWSRWTHAFLLQGQRPDGHHWVIESDLEMQHKYIRLGVQENRVDKFHDASVYSTLAIVDFGLTPEQTNTLVSAGLDLVAKRARYSLRELLGTLVALRRGEARDRENRLAQEHSYFCSALVHQVYRTAGVDLFPGVDVKHTTPEELSRSPRPHTQWLLEREVATPVLTTMLESVRHKVEVRRRARARKRHQAEAAAAKPEADVPSSLLPPPIP